MLPLRKELVPHARRELLLLLRVLAAQLGDLGALPALQLRLLLRVWSERPRRAPGRCASYARASRRRSKAPAWLRCAHEWSGRRATCRRSGVRVPLLREHELLLESLLLLLLLLLPLTPQQRSAVELFDALRLLHLLLLQPLLLHARRRASSHRAAGVPAEGGPVSWGD